MPTRPNNPLSRNSSATIGTSVYKIAEAIVEPAQRQTFTIINTSTANQTIYLALGQEAVVGQGIKLAPGAAWNESLDSAFIPSNDFWYAVSDAANGSIAIQERIIGNYWGQ